MQWAYLSFNTPKKSDLFQYILGVRLQDTESMLLVRYPLQYLSIEEMKLIDAFQNVRLWFLMGDDTFKLHEV